VANNDTRIEQMPSLFSMALRIPPLMVRAADLQLIKCCAILLLILHVNSTTYNIWSGNILYATRKRQKRHVYFCRCFEGSLFQRNITNGNPHCYDQTISTARCHGSLPQVTMESTAVDCLRGRLKLIQSHSYLKRGEITIY